MISSSLHVLGRLVLGLLLFVQSGPTCACAIAHLVLCERASAAPVVCVELAIDAGPSCEGTGCAAAGPCSPHSGHNTNCSVLRTSETTNRQAPGAVPVFAIVDRSLSRPDGGSVTPHLSRAPVSPGIPLTSARSLPLLI